jgi:DNA repair protein RecO (recombination protein O)
MRAKTRAFVLKHVRYGEKGAIVTLFTEQLGIKTIFVNSVKSKSFKPSYLEPFALLDVDIEYREKNNLHRLLDVRCNEPFNHIHNNIIKKSLLLFLNEIVQHSIGNNESADNKVFDFLLNGLQQLNTADSVTGNYHLSFLIQLSRHLGFYPEGNYSPEEPVFDLMEGCFTSEVPSHNLYLQNQNAERFDCLVQTPLNETANISINNSQRKQLLNAVIDFYKLHINDFGQINSMGVLQELFND